MQIEFPKQVVADPAKVVLFDKKKVGMVAAFAVVLFSLLGIFLGDGGEKRRILDFFKVQTEVHKLEKGEQPDLDSIGKLVQEHREVAPFFDASLLQGYFLSDESGKAQEVGERSLKRLSHMEAPYADFAKNSLLIEQGNMQAALISAIALQERIEGNKDYLKISFFNLIRIGLLKQGLQVETKEAWDKVAKFLSKENEMLDESLRATLISHLSDGNSTFLDFLESRR